MAINMGKIIAIVNQKGGVGKTTTAVNLTAAVGALGKKALLVDIDPQGNATSGLGINKREIALSTYDNIINGVPAEKTIVHSPFKNVDVIPSNMDLAGAELELVELPRREAKLRTSLALIKNQESPALYFTIRKRVWSSTICCRTCNINHFFLNYKLCFCIYLLVTLRRIIFYKIISTRRKFYYCFVLCRLPLRYNRFSAFIFYVKHCTCKGFSFRIYLADGYTGFVFIRFRHSRRKGKHYKSCQRCHKNGNQNFNKWFSAGCFLAQISILFH